MGNRAIIAAASHGVAIYLHWNGGRPSIEAFLEYCRLKHYRTPAEDEPYAMARLAQVIANFFGGGISVGVIPCSDDASMAAATDHGVYLINEWQIEGRVAPHESYEEDADADPAASLLRRLHAIDAMQPAGEQLGSIIDAPLARPHELEVGDRVWVYTDYRQINNRYQGGYLEAEVLGFGDAVLGGTVVVSSPYVGLFPGDDGDYQANVNNYLMEPEYRRAS